MNAIDDLRFAVRVARNNLPCSEEEPLFIRFIRPLDVDEGKAHIYMMKTPNGKLDYVHDFPRARTGGAVHGLFDLADPKTLPQHVFSTRYLE